MSNTRKAIYYAVKRRQDGELESAPSTGLPLLFTNKQAVERFSPHYAEPVEVEVTITERPKPVKWVGELWASLGDEGGEPLAMSRQDRSVPTLHGNEGLLRAVVEGDDDREARPIRVRVTIEEIRDEPEDS
jgi:hypothetical protein